MYVPRTLQKALREALEQFSALLLTGPRQSGKTTLLRHELAADRDYVTFDDPLERDFVREDPQGFLDRFPGPVVFDEVQYVPELLPYLKMRIDQGAEPGRYVLTGSQRFQLMAGVSESLAGRISILELLPLSFAELATVDEPALADTLWRGLYPDPALYPAKRPLWVSSYLQTYVERDVRQIHNVQDLTTFERFLALLASRHAQQLNAADLARQVGVSQPTAARWAEVLEAAYVLFRLPPYFENLGKRLVKSPKMYFLDPALVCTLTRQPDGEAALAGAAGGALFEGLVVAEAVKAFTHRGMRPELYFWRTRDGQEIDLLLPVGSRLHPVEIKLTATPSSRHLGAARRFREDIGEDRVGPPVLVCRVPERRPLPGGGQAIPWQEFGAWVAELLTGRT